MAKSIAIGSEVSKGNKKGVVTEETELGWRVTFGKGDDAEGVDCKAKDLKLSN